MIAQITFCLLSGAANRARGSQLFGLVSSTVIGRIVAMLAIATGAALLTLDGDWLHFDVILLWTFAALMLWCTPAWDSLWSATIGHDPAHSRLWGLAHLGLRMALAAPCILGLAFLTGHPAHAIAALATPILAVPYYGFGYAAPQEDGKYVIPLSELSAGVLLGALICLCVA